MPTSRKAQHSQQREELLKTLSSLKSPSDKAQKLLSLLENYNQKNAEKCKELFLAIKQELAQAKQVPADASSISRERSFSPRQGRNYNNYTSSPSPHRVWPKGESGANPNSSQKYVAPVSRRIRTTAATSQSSSIPSGDFTYRAITANCGNGTLGTLASQKITQQIKQEKADFYIINCQNEQFGKMQNSTFKKLSEHLKTTDYQVLPLSEMGKQGLRADSSGMSCYVIYNTQTVGIENIKSKGARGQKSNKGGLITDFKVINKKNNQEQLSIESVTARLSKDKPIQDWYTVHHELAHDLVSSWDDLCQVTPNLRVMGIDTNIPVSGKKSQWTDKKKHPGTWALTQAPMGQKVSTANGSNAGLIAISDGIKSSQRSHSSLECNAAVVNLGDSKNLDRVVVMGELSTVSSKSNEFERVQTYMANQLQASAPKLADDIRGLKGISGDKETLVKIHNTYLSNGGVLDFKLKQAANEKPNDAFQGQAWLAEVTLDNAFKRSDVADRLIANIGNYGEGTADPKKLALLSDDAKAALFAKKVKYNKPSIFDTSKDDQRHRKAFIEYVMKLDDSLPKQSEKERNQLIAAQKIEKAATTMEALLGKEGIRLYKKALEEERNSPEYMTAVFCKSTNHYEGARFKAPVAIPVGGPSGAGKSYNAKAIVKDLMDKEANVNRKDRSGNYVVSIDGGIAREAQMRRLAIQLANKKNYTFILDLESKSKALGSVKQSVDNAARTGGEDGQPLSTVIPLTFSDMLLDRQVNAYFDGLEKTYGKNYHFSMVTDVDHVTVKNQGIARSAETEFKNTEDEYNLNKATCESKKYSEGPKVKIISEKGISFLAGEQGSEHAEKIYFQRNPGAVSLHVANPLRLYTPVDPADLNGDWQQTNDYAAPHAQRIHKQLFQNWITDRQQNPSTEGLMEYNKAHWKDQTYGAQAEQHNQAGKVGEARVDVNGANVSNSLPPAVVDPEVSEADTIKTLLGNAEAQIEALDAQLLSFDPQGRVLLDVAECIVQVLNGEPDEALKQEIAGHKKVVLIKNGNNGETTWTIGYRDANGQYASRNLDNLPEDITGKINPLGNLAVITDLALLNDIKAAVSPDITLPSFQAHTTVSYDISHLPIVKAVFAEKIKEKISEDAGKDNIYHAYDGITNKSSIIPLQQEFHFHLRLALRAYAAEVVEMTAEQFQQIHDETMQVVNTHVMEEFGKALEAAYVPASSSINIDILNQKLDEARKTIVPLAHQALFEKIKSIANDNKNITALSSDEIAGLKHIAETTTATSNDLLHTDNAMKLVTRMSGTDVTAHDRDFGVNHVADVKVQAYKYDSANLDQLAAVDQRTHVGVPSLAVKKIKSLINGKGDVELNFPPIITKRAINRKSLSETKPVPDDEFKALMGASLIKRGPDNTSPTVFIQDEVSNKIYCKKDDQLISLTTEQAYMLVEFVLAQDVKEKLDYLSEKHFANLPTDEDDKKPRAFIYNLYTSIHSDFVDKRVDKNFQTESLKAILTGALLHNKKGEPYCFVQAIAVNGYGYKLAYGSQNIVLEEATLMTEMALLHTIYDSVVDAELKKSIDKLFSNYGTFLTTNKQWFSSHDPDPIAQIRAIKLALTQDKLKAYDGTTGLLAQKCLAKILAQDEHFSNDARVIQALSVFCEKASIGGCKSRNERTQMVNSRVQLLDNKNEEVVAALRGFVEMDRTHTFTQLQEVFDSQCNDKNLYGAASLISNNDQGAAAKINPRGSLPDTNNAEAKGMTNLHQKNAKKMQAHNGLTDPMVKTIKDKEKVSVWVKVKTAMTALYDKLPSPSSLSVPSFDGIKKSIRNMKQPRLILATAVFVAIAVSVSVLFPPALPVFIVAGLAGGALVSVGYRQRRLNNDAMAFQKEKDEEIIGGSELLMESGLGVVESKRGASFDDSDDEKNIINGLSDEGVTHVPFSRTSVTPQSPTSEQAANDSPRLSGNP